MSTKSAALVTRRISPHGTPPGKGRVRIGEHSSLRKLMRGARRGLVPQERIGVIVRAMQSAIRSHHGYMNAHMRRLVRLAESVAPSIVPFEGSTDAAGVDLGGVGSLPLAPEHAAAIGESA